ncbi:MAG: ComEC/Rec2 family competence protein [Verrucomicrobia bacterium]|nr:ComEC/Rec2 family competence protein [Verrucomicrobiota bacterium]MDE3048161.1 ComEC/Rec2 family competence protein [Verrucomicrobiota bacterium]
MNQTVFWQKYPALLYGISLLVGTSSVLFWPFPWQWVWPFCMGLYLLFLRKVPPLCLLIAGMYYASFFSPTLESARVGYFSPAILKPHQTPFTKELMYQGVLTAQGQRVPCGIAYTLSEDHPKANCDYIVKGILKKRSAYDYLFKAKEWIPVENTWRLAEFRFQCKEALRHFLDTHLHRPRVASFLGSLLTGDVEDRALRFEFSKLGLQHILAISGFHFAILISFCTFFLNLFLSHRSKYLVLLCSVSLYFLFVGSVPAVQRSYLTVLFFTVGKLLNRPSTGLNLLGASLLIEVLLNPLVSANLGFQMSFLSCIGILLFRPLFLPVGQFLFPVHRNLTLISQNGYLLTSFLREAIALTLAVNAALLPLLLYHFHTFPLLSLLYNLFFPFLISLSLFLLLLSLLLYLLFPPLSLFFLTDFLTAQWLDLAAYPPLFLDYSIRCHSVPAWTIPIYLVFLFLAATRLESSELKS